MKSSEHVKALQLRQSDVSYQAIMSEVGVAKSTLWRWLKAAGMVDDNNSPERIQNRGLAQQKAAETVHRLRLERTRAIMASAAQDIGSLTSRELLLIGAALYWAEGAKQNGPDRCSQVLFGNMDPTMHRLFLRFLNECCGIPPSTLRFRIYLHETADGAKARTYWFNQLGIEAIRSAPISWKRHKPVTFRKTNVGDTYHGLLRICVPKSTNLNRRIAGWVRGMGVAIGEWCNGSTLAFEAISRGSSPRSPALLREPGIETESFVVECDRSSTMWEALTN